MKLVKTVKKQHRTTSRDIYTHVCDLNPRVNPPRCSHIEGNSLESLYRCMYKADAIYVKQSKMPFGIVHNVVALCPDHIQKLVIKK